MNVNDFLANFADQFEDTDPSEITLMTKFRELDEWDSLMTLTIIAFIKTNYKVAVNATEIRTCNTPEDLFILIQNKL